MNSCRLCPTTDTLTMPRIGKKHHIAAGNDRPSVLISSETMTLQLLDRLDQWKSRFGSGKSVELEKLLVVVRKLRLPDAASLIRLHETLLFLRAYPRRMLIRPIEQRIETAEQFFAGINARVIHLGNRAFYSPADDAITLPPFAAFFTPTDYYSTRAHETGHWQ